MAGRGRRREFPEAFEREAVERARTSGLTIIAVVGELGLHETVRAVVDQKCGEPGMGLARRSPTAIPDGGLDGGRRRPIWRPRTRGSRRGATSCKGPRSPARSDQRHSDQRRSGLARRSGHPMMFGFVDEHEDAWPISVMCRVLGASVGGCHAWRSRPEGARSRADRTLLDATRVVHAESGGTHGAPRVHAVLRAPGPAGRVRTADSRRGPTRSGSGI